jgi:hypothetical protein
MFDFPLHDAGDFDAITSLWIHVVLVVSGETLTTYDDGRPVSDAVYGFYTGGGVADVSNVAYPHPGTLTGTFGAFAMAGPIHLGSRSDHDENRHFLGDMAGLMISEEDLTPIQIACIFSSGEDYLPSRLSQCSDDYHGVLSLSLLNSLDDTSGHDNTATAHGAELTFSGATFNGDDAYISVSGHRLRRRRRDFLHFAVDDKRGMHGGHLRVPVLAPCVHRRRHVGHVECESLPWVRGGGWRLQ